MKRVEAISYTYDFTSFSLRKFDKLPFNIQKRIIQKFRVYIATGNPLLFAHKMSPPDSDKYRYRIGDYRIVILVEGTHLTIHDIGHRREIYR